MKKDNQLPEFDTVEQDIVSLLQKIQSAIPQSDTDGDMEDDLFGDWKIEGKDGLPGAPATPDSKLADMPLILSVENLKANSDTYIEDNPQEINYLPSDIQLISAAAQEEVPPRKPGFFRKALRGIFPHKGDPKGEIARKCIFLVSLIIFITSLGFLCYYMVLEPQQVNSQNEHYADLYNDTVGNENITVDSENTTIEDPIQYPEGMQASFKQLYAINEDVAGWLSYTSSDADTFLNINLPVVHCDNNDKYLDHGFDGTKSRSGTLFFDASNTFEQGTVNKVNIIYGHNMASGTMLAPLNKLIGSVYRVRSAPVISLDTLYDSHKYQVFAVIVCDEDAASDKHFGYLRTSFADDADFLSYVGELRARSLFDYPIEIAADDDLLILSTCTNKSQVKIPNGRLAVIARRIQEGENPSIDTTRITKNDDVIMPYAWYTAQDLTPHAFYTEAGYDSPQNSTTQATDMTTTIVGAGDDTTSSDTDTSDTTPSSDGDTSSTGFVTDTTASGSTDETAAETDSGTTASTPSTENSAVTDITVTENTTATTADTTNTEPEGTEL